MVTQRFPSQIIFSGCVNLMGTVPRAKHLGFFLVLPLYNQIGDWIFHLKIESLTQIRLLKGDKFRTSYYFQISTSAWRHRYKKTGKMTHGIQLATISPGNPCFNRVLWRYLRIDSITSEEGLNNSLIRGAGESLARISLSLFVCETYLTSV